MGSAGPLLVPRVSENEYAQNRFTTPIKTWSENSRFSAGRSCALPASNLPLYSGGRKPYTGWLGSPAEPRSTHARATVRAPEDMVKRAAKRD